MTHATLEAKFNFQANFNENMIEINFDRILLFALVLANIDARILLFALVRANMDGRVCLLRWSLLILMAGFAFCTGPC